MQGHCGVYTWMESEGLSLDLPGGYMETTSRTSKLAGATWRGYPPGWDVYRGAVQDAVGGLV